MSKSKLEEILDSGDLARIKSLFLFNHDDDNDMVVLKFGMWARYFFLKYFKSEDAPFHDEMDLNIVRAYRGEIKQFVNIAFRGAAKTARTKLFIAYCIANDLENTRKFIRCLSAELDNAKQSVTDIYNMLIQPRVRQMYPEIFRKTDSKREETMGSFTTATLKKVIAKQIGVDQRGKIMEDARADFDWYDDIETRVTIRSAVLTHKIGENMEEARTGLALGGSSVYTANYFSEMGNVHKLVTEKSSSKVVMITPIITDKGELTWPSRYTKKDIEEMRQDDEDFEGERLCKPNAAKDIYFDRDQLDKMPRLIPIREIGEFKIFKEYRPDHRYAGGHDVAGGVGLDSSASVFIDFDTVPAQVVGTFHSNSIAPESFGDEMYAQANRFGGCLIAPENNKFEQAILKAKQLGANIYKTIGRQIKIGYQEPTTWGWNTNSLTKSKMFSAFRLAVEDGLIELNDPDLIQEAASYTRNDVIDKEPDARLTTRHFDLLTAACIAWQMKDYAKSKPKKPDVYEGWANRAERSGNPAL